MLTSKGSETRTKEMRTTRSILQNDKHRGRGTYKVQTKVSVEDH